jgi:single-stranded DNA-binding protein
MTFQEEFPELSDTKMSETADHKQVLLDMLPGLNYAVVTGIIKRRKALALTRSGIPVLHILVENRLKTYFDNPETVVSEIEVDAWGKLATSLDEKLHPGDAILIEGRLAHRKTNDRTGGTHFKTLLRARRIQLIFNTERKA